MPTIFSPAIAGGALGALFAVPARPPRYWIAGALCAALPDADVVAFWLGVPWGHALGHRGITHSLTFAAVLAALVVGLAFRARAWHGRRFLGERGWRVLQAEALWVWMPAAGLAAAGTLTRARRRR